MIEVLIVIVIIGVLSVLALPRLFGNVECMRAEEARQILLQLLTAQKHYFLENGVYANNMSDLDIEFKIAPDNFFMPSDGDINSNNPVAQLRRRGGAYTIKISDNGIFSCSGSASLCPVIVSALNN